MITIFCILCENIINLLRIKSDNGLIYVGHYGIDSLVYFPGSYTTYGIMYVNVGGQLYNL